MRLLTQMRHLNARLGMQSTKTNIGLTDQIDNSDVQAKHCQSFSNFATQTKSENCYSQELRNIIIYEKNI